jgi:hypothetical protein
MSVVPGSWTVECTCGDELRIEVVEEFLRDGWLVRASHRDWARGAGWVAAERFVPRRLPMEHAMPFAVEVVVREVHKQTGCGDYALVETGPRRREWKT